MAEELEGAVGCVAGGGRWGGEWLMTKKEDLLVDLEAVCLFGDLGVHVVAGVFFSALHIGVTIKSMGREPPVGKSKAALRSHAQACSRVVFVGSQREE